MLTGFKLCCVQAGVACLLSCFGGSTYAQLLTDPASLPVADISQLDQDPARGVVISVKFNSMTSVELERVMVANTRAKGSIGNPPLILLELLDHDGQLISSQNAWHPLWVHDWDGSEVENLVIEDSGTGTFYVPLSESLAAVRISDIELAQELITVDVASTVLDYCTATPGTPICALFLSGFE